MSLWSLLSWGQMLNGGFKFSRLTCRLACRPVLVVLVPVEEEVEAKGAGLCPHLVDCRSSLSRYQAVRLALSLAKVRSCNEHLNVTKAIHKIIGTKGVYLSNPAAKRAIQTNSAL